jgi:hypothetical protein
MKTILQLATMYARQRCRVAVPAQLRRRQSGWVMAVTTSPPDLAASRKNRACGCSASDYRDNP